MNSLLDPPPAAANPASEGRALRRAWQDAMARWQQGPDGQPNGRPVHDPGACEQVTLTDLDPALCARQGWR